MNKQERGKLIKLYEEALRVNRDTGLTYPNPTYQFNQGYEWGINEAMKAAGFDRAELFAIWERIKFVEPYEVEEEEAPMYESSGACPWNRNQSDEAEALAQLREWTEDPHQDPPAWACGQDPYRCESCGSLIREDLTCPRCDAVPMEEIDPADYEDPEPGIEDHEHFQVKHDDRRRVFVIQAKPHVLEWRVMPRDVFDQILKAEQDWKDKGYRYADIDEEV